MKKLSLRSGLLATTTICGAALSTMAGGALVATVATMLPTVAQAQDFTSGSLTGMVKSEAGAPAAGATVTIVGQSNGYTTTTTTAEDGTFRISQIPTGSYNVEITTASGAKASETVLVTLGSISSYDFIAGGEDASATTVVVKGKARRNIDFNRTTTGQVIDVQTMATKIPLGRDLNALADIVPGISINDSFGTPPIGQPAISGSSPAENVYYIDGMNVTNFRNFLGGSTVPFDFYDQVEVKTGGYSAEYGRSTGGAFIATSRSGSNTFHGGLSYYYSPASLASDGALAAKDLNAIDDNGDPNPLRTRQTAEDSAESSIWLSGPIWKDHIFAFGFYNQRDLGFAYSDTDTKPGVAQYSPSYQKDPFYGGKLTFQLNPQHRLDFTYINDDQTRYDHNYNRDTGVDGLVYAKSGGLTRIVKYTGKFTDWFTLSAMYGSSTFNQTTSSVLDSDPAVYLGGNIVRGNPVLLVDSGRDNRKNYRLDADFYFDLMGRHHLRVGGDEEKLNAQSLSQYSGGTYYRYYDIPADPGTISCGGYADTTSCVRVRQIFGGGSFDVVNDALYIEDDWAITDRLNLNLGLRQDSFDNRNAAGESFVKTDNLISPRLGLSYDLFGDKATKLTASYGRYYLPIAANSNIRMAGGETFTEKYYTWTSRDADTLVPVLGTWLNPDPADYVLEDGVVPDASTLVSHNLEPQYEDEYILGYETRLNNGWKLGAHYMYRKLANVLEDTDLTEANKNPCTVLGISEDDCGTFGSSNYVLVNPGKDIVITLGDSFGGGWAGKTVTIKAADNGLPQAKRIYEALEFDFERPDDGKWYLGGSLVLSKSEGNIEGGVKSDNGQTDTGLTQDFDQVGWTDGSYGLLPNHHGISAKAYGLYHWNDKLDFGFNAAILSPRHYGCIGYYPKDDGRADSSTLTAWYCNGVLTPRGDSFKGDWITKMDVSIGYTQPVALGTIRYGVDIFNLFNSQGANVMGEFGEISGSGTPNLNYKQPTSYQTPRYVRFSIRYGF
ncbi:TonB-dependent receptor [Asticcacaulis taihuensis]|uniref:TonB-dependent receptor n=1 Tax=Asticcacaulis taihuensis TaxID=260084 RepID=UPI003F7BB425